MTIKLDKNLYILMILAGLYSLPIILANTYYTDDMGRIVGGYTWNGDGRFIATYLSRILSFQSHITSFFPFSILISALLITYSCIMLLNKLNLYDHDNTFKIVNLSALFLLISPFLLENLAYRFDSIYMALSIFFAIFPLVFYQHKYFIGISITCIIITFGLYQSTTMLYFASLLALQIKLALSGKAIPWKLHFSAFISFILAFGIYQLLLKVGGYDISRNALLPISIESINIIKARLYNYAETYSTLLISSKYLLALAFTLLGALIGLMTQLNQLPSTSIKIQKLLVIVLSLFGIVCCTLLPNLIIQTMWLTARTFIIFPIFLVVLAIFIHPLFSASSKTYRYLATASYLILLIYSFMLSSIFGTILKNNDQFHDYLATEITSIILKQPITDANDIKLVISGQAPKAYKSQLLYRTYPIMNLLAPNYLAEGWYWGLRRLSTFHNFSWPENKEQPIKNQCSFTVIHSSVLYKIRQNNNIFVVDFNNSCTQ